MSEVVGYIISGFSYFLQSVSAFVAPFVGSDVLPLFGIPFYQWILGILIVSSIISILVYNLLGGDDE